MRVNEITNKTLVESVHVTPVTDKQFDELKDRLSRPIPAEIANVVLDKILESDDLTDEFRAIAKNKPTYDVRTVVVNWIKTNMPSDMYRFADGSDDPQLKQGTYSTLGYRPR